MAKSGIFMPVEYIFLQSVPAGKQLIVIKVFLYAFIFLFDATMNVDTWNCLIYNNRVAVREDSFVIFNPENYSEKD